MAILMLFLRLFLWCSRATEVTDYSYGCELVLVSCLLIATRKAVIGLRRLLSSPTTTFAAPWRGFVFQNVNGGYGFSVIECNRSPQVEKEALALLQKDSSGNRRYTFAELIMRARGNPPSIFVPTEEVKVGLHARWLQGNPDNDGNTTYQAGNVLGMSGPRLGYINIFLQNLWHQARYRSHPTRSLGSP